jgi:hypothetical protein
MNVAVGIVVMLSCWAPADIMLIYKAKHQRPATKIERPATQIERLATQIERPATQIERPATKIERLATQTERLSADAGVAEEQPQEPPVVPPRRIAPPAEQRTYRQQYMPLAPTEISAGEAGGYPFLTPTERPPVVGPSRYATRPTVAPQAGAAPLRRSAPPMSATEARRLAHYGRSGRYGQQIQPPRSYVDYRIEQTQFRTAESYRTSPASARAQLAQSRKPFTNFKRGPAISPYLNLFRLDTEGGTLDNYSTLVRPEFVQRKTNVRVGGDIRTLASKGYLQNAAIRQIGNEARALEGRPSQDYYMNLLGFYPGFSR